MNCSRKHTLVTGASSGIGRATALRLAAGGQHVYAGVRTAADGQQLVRRAAGGELTPLILDVTDASHIAAAAAAINGHAVAPPQDRILYEDAFGKMLAVMRRREDTGSPPDVAAATITRALTTTRPRHVYLAGKYSRRLALLSLLPSPLLDAARRRVFGLPAPGSLAS